MSGPPLDVAVTLPPDWQEQVLAIQPDGPERPFINFLQGYIRQHDWESIAVTAVQMLAKWATTGLGRPDGETPFPRLRGLLVDIEERAGRWAIQTVIEERQGLINAHPIDLSLGLCACEAEWRVLQYLLKRDWLAIKRPRQDGDFDWHIQKSETLGIEVKHKAAIGSASHALEWWLKGLSLLPDAAWMYVYCWYCQLPESARLPEVHRFGKALQTQLKQVSGALDDELAKAEAWGDPRKIAIGDTDLLIVPDRWGNRPAVTLTLRSAPDLRVTVERNAVPQVLCITGYTGDGWVLPVLGEAETDEVRRVLGRLRAAKENAPRSMTGLFVFVWWIPHVWEITYDRTWMRHTCDAIAGQLALEYAAIWPQGYFETAHELWMLSAKAVLAFPELEDQIR